MVYLKRTWLILVCVLFLLTGCSGGGGGGASTATIEGTVFYNGQYQTTSVYLYEQVLGQIGTTTTNESGYFCFTNVGTTGKYYVTCTVDGDELYNPEWVSSKIYNPITLGINTFNIPPNVFPTPPATPSP